MLEWLGSNVAYWHWIVLGLILISFELFAPVFVLLWLGTAAIAVGAIMTIIPLSTPAQLIIWIFLSMGSVFFWHIFMSPRMKDKTLAGLSREAMIGQVGMVTFYSQDQGRGKLKFPAPVVGNDEWEFIHSETLANGDKVQVIDLSGNSLLVKAI